MRVGSKAVPSVGLKLLAGLIGRVKEVHYEVVVRAIRGDKGRSIPAQKMVSVALEVLQKLGTEEE